MSTDTWLATSTTADWATAANWSGGAVPGAADTAFFPMNTTSGSHGPAKIYVVSVGASDDNTVGTIQLDDSSADVHARLSISGILDTTTLLYTGAEYSGFAGNQIQVNAGGVFGVGSISDPSALPESIDIYSTGAGGTFELSSFTAGNQNVTYDFLGSASVASAGVIDYASITSGTTIDQPIQNFNWGDKIILGSPGEFAGATATLSGNSLTVQTGVTTDAVIQGVTSAPGTTYEVLNGDTVIAVCYARGTLLRTPAGERAVETLSAGDGITVLEDGALVSRKVKWLGHRRIDLTTHPRPELVAPVRIRAGAFDDNLPDGDLVLSPDHAVFVDGKLIAARQLVNGASIVQENGWTAVDYYHVELDRHSILIAQGLPAESYLDTANRGFFANGGAPLTLHPDLAEDRSALSRAAGACAPFVVDEASIRPIWQRLADRAAALGLLGPRAPSTSDPNLRLVAKGRTIAPVFAEAGLFIFPLPVGATGGRVVSRAATPTAVRPWLDDRRELGVAVKRIVLRTADDVIDIPVDGPDLREGWWDVERSGSLTQRWTNGRALLALPPFKGHAMLELHVQATMDYKIEADATVVAEHRAGAA